MHDINIVIVNKRMKSDICRCLDSLFYDLKTSNLSAIVQVVDNSNNIDGIKEVLGENYPQVNYINPGKNLGFGRAQNLGLKKIPAKYYLPLNPDIEFLPGSQTLEKMVNFMENNPKVGLAGPKLLNFDGTVQLSCCRFPRLFDQFFRRLNYKKVFKKRVDYYLMQDFTHDKTAPVDWVIGSFMLIRNKLAEQIGFFDEKYFMYFEDCDLCRRAWQAGWQVYYNSETIVKHGHRRDSADKSIFMSAFNPLSWVHLKSWLRYFMKWGIKNVHYGI